MIPRLLACVTTILLAGTVWAEGPVCPADPGSCSDCPQECCVMAGGLLLYECVPKSSGFVISDVENNGSIAVNLTSPGGPANFSVAGLTVNNFVIGNATIAPPSFTIGDSAKNARFATSDGGQCVGVSGFTGLVLPSAVVVGNRALTLSKSNPLFCRSPQLHDVLCFQVKGQVSAPPPVFPQFMCTPDRVEYACGAVS